jgi:hypothetical protein
MGFVPRFVIALGLAFALFEGCKCDPNIGKQAPGICAKDTECPKGQVYRKGVCALERCDNRGDNRDGDCCPGQLCKNDGRCVDKTATCERDAECGGTRAGRLCLSRPAISAETKICAYPLPDANGDCPATYREFNKRCIRDLPCDGGCEGDTVCNIETNECEALPNIPTSSSNCDVSCGAGTIKVYADPDGMSFGQCCALACVCEALPPLSEGVYGRYASAQVTPTEILVASYNETYGDLVLSHHDKVSGKKLKLEFIDGLPMTSAALQGDPTGPRAGAGELGPNVGMYSSLALGGDGQPRIVYYDNDNKDLKYAEKTSSGWAISVIDGGPGASHDVGQYASLQYLAGRLRVAYFARSTPSVSGQAGPFTTLRYAEALTPSPRGPSDWSVVDAVPPAPVRNPCNGTCTQTESCVYVETPGPSRKVCGKREAECDGTEPEGSVCVSVPGVDGKAYYPEDPVPQVTELPSGIGLSPSFAQKGDTLLLAYYDNYTPPSDTPPFKLNTGRLRGITAALTSGTTGAFTTPVTLDNGSTCDGKARDVGRFSFVAVAPNGRTGVAYIDSTRGELRFYQPPNASDTFLNDDGCFETSQTTHANGRIYVADTGVDTAMAGVTLVGADAYLSYDQSSHPSIVYQDQSNLNVRVTGLRTDGKWTVDYLSQEKGDGFEVQLLQDNTDIWLVSVLIGFDNIGNSTNQVLVRKVNLPSIP